MLLRIWTPNYDIVMSLPVGTSHHSRKQYLQPSALLYSCSEPLNLVSVSYIPLCCCYPCPKFYLTLLVYYYHEKQLLLVKGHNHFVQCCLCWIWPTLFQRLSFVLEFWDCISQCPGQRLTAKKLRQPINRRRGSKLNQKGTGSWAIQGISGAICLALPWVLAPSSSPTQCNISHDKQKIRAGENV